MCFRPGDVDMSKPCPECGKLLHATSGVFPKTCPFCGTSLAGLVDESELSATGGTAPAAPAAPGVPAAPGAPAAPAAPKPVFTPPTLNLDKYK